MKRRVDEVESEERGLDEIIASERTVIERKRVPIGVHRSKMSVPQELKEPGYVYRFFNDEGTRLMDAELGGYEFVKLKDGMYVGDPNATNTSDMGSRYSIVATQRGKDDKPVRAYLMRIKKEWYDADQKEKETTNNLVDNAIKQGGFKVDENNLPRNRTYGHIEYTP